MKLTDEEIHEHARLDPSGLNALPGMYSCGVSHGAKWAQNELLKRAAVGFDEITLEILHLRKLRLGEDQMNLISEINALLIHYKKGYDPEFVNKARLVREEIEALQSQAALVASLRDHILRYEQDLRESAARVEERGIEED